MEERIVVTGAAGFIGQHLIRTLKKRGKYRIMAVDIAPWALLTTLKAPTEVRQCDITDRRQLKKLFRRGDKIVHLAAVSTFGATEKDRSKATMVNCVGTLNVVLEAIKAKASRIIFSSTGSVFSIDSPVPIRENAPKDPPNFYGLTKLIAEQIIRFHTNQLPHVILRYGYVYGVGKTHGAIGAFIHYLKLAEQPSIYGGGQTNDFTYVKDIVNATLLALDTPYINEDYNVGSGRANSILDVYDECKRALKSKIQPALLPPRKEDYGVFLYDIEKARKLLKYEPQWNIHDGIEDMVKQLG